ncbi:MAG: NblA/ycf18 family protein [Pseudanabaena sp. CAN_BIN31]|nr:NblA/ycf18 family protein [Pseudanabaena sp. CAN_BIN31]
MNINSFSLNLEQEFQMKLVEDSVQKMDREQMSGLLIDLARIVMIKDNAIRDLLKNEILPYSKFEKKPFLDI